MISCESEVSSPLDSSSSVDAEVSSPLEEFTFAILNLIAMISLSVIVVSLAITACYVWLVSFLIISSFRIEENEWSLIFLCNAWKCLNAKHVLFVDTKIKRVIALAQSV